MIETILLIIFYFNIFVLFYFLILNFSYLLLLVLASSELFYYKKRSELHIFHDMDCVLIPKVALLVPCYNEEQSILDSVDSMLNIDYSELEVILINDGSSDNTLEVLKKRYNLVRVSYFKEEKIKTKKIKNIYKSTKNDRLIVIDKENGGKADSLNVGLNHSRSKLFCAIDADSIIEKDALKKLVFAYLDRPGKVIAFGGIVHVANGCLIENGQVKEVRLSKKYLPAVQSMEYIRAFLCGRTGWSKLNNLLIISGAFGLFDKKTVIECGGYLTDCIGEDMELVIRLHKYMRDKKTPYKMLFIPDPVCWTQVPESLRVLERQRTRWGQGLIESLRHNWKMIGNPKYGMVGCIAMPYFIFFEMLGPLIELIGYVVVIISFIFGLINYKFLFLFLLLAILFGVLISLYSLLLEECTVKRYNNTKDRIKLFILAVVENFGYRQINSWWRFKAIINVLMAKSSWGEMDRKSFARQR